MTASVPTTNNKSRNSVSNDALGHSSAEKPKEPVYYMESANGMLVRVPQSKLEAWQAEQDRQRNCENLELTEQERKLKEDILERIYGTERGPHEEKTNKDPHRPAAPFR